jgi:hypothetical protein
MFFALELRFANPDHWALAWEASGTIRRYSPHSRSIPAVGAVHAIHEIGHPRYLTGGVRSSGIAVSFMNGLLVSEIYGVFFAAFVVAPLNLTGRTR